MKRLIDIVFAVFFLVLLSPLLLLLAAAVWINDPGPIIYRGPRVGRYGRDFRILKFRSMRVDQSGAKRAITIENDPRVTAVGRFLRGTKLDELPQLFNVLKGDMSLVGPRPEAPDYVARYTPEQRLILNVRPGITGLSQVYFRNEEQLLTGRAPEFYYFDAIMPAKLTIDLEYVRRQSVLFDIKVLILTAISLVRPFPVPPLPPMLEDRETAKQETPVPPPLSQRPGAGYPPASRPEAAQRPASSFPAATRHDY
ncbi:MAG: sugar transferase [Ktedonobacterales bacterium]|nr:sugar transferase [Ktedonobacterales bacterium]